MTWNTWIKQVDGLLEDLTGKGIGQLPIPIESWEILYEQGYQPLNAVKAAIRLIFEIGVPEPKGKDN